MGGFILYETWRTEWLLTHPKRDGTRRKETAEGAIVVACELSGSAQKGKKSTSLYRHISPRAL